MTFKTNWEKPHAQHKLGDNMIMRMLEITYPAHKVNQYEIIAGGCANLNIKVGLASLDSPVILRVYLRDPKAAYKEQKIAQTLAGKIPLPQIYQIAETLGYTFAIAQYLPGITLRDQLLNNKKTDVADIMLKVGTTLAHIADTKFDQSGFFNEKLHILKPITQDGLIAFYQDTLNSDQVMSALSAEKRKQLYDLATTGSNLFPCGQEKNLVHADFDPANILVQEINSQLEVSGILDWEFSFAGSTLCDVANMLRYAHHMPQCYESSFLQGLTTGGYNLPAHWRSKIHMLNLLSLLDCLIRSDSKNQPNRLSDIRQLIDHILDFFIKNNQDNHKPT